MWYLGNTFEQFTGADSYVQERNGNTYGENPATWRGKIGLMYLSDYYYDNNNFYSDPDTYDFSDACGDKWLCAFDGADYDYEWTLFQMFDPLLRMDVVTTVLVRVAMSSPLCIPMVTRTSKLLQLLVVSDQHCI